ncbi:PARP14 [Bugula neritina]|nr:PARP14 [Bugula neritina]
MKIVEGKFDRGYSGKNASVYGQGCYFAKNASYSAKSIYSAPNTDDEKIILQCRVITGDWCRGEQNMPAAPCKPNSNIQFDSVVNDMNDPTIFAVFHDAAAYPEYIIKFKILK